MVRRFPYDLEMRHYFEDNEWCHRINQAGAGKFYRAVDAIGIHYYESKGPNPSQPVEERRKQAMKYLETLAYFYRKHGIIYVGVFHFVPELGFPINPLTISSARILLELVNSYGGDWVLEKWNKHQLASLFAAPSLSAQVVEKEQTIEALETLSAQVAAKDAELQRITGTLGWRILGVYGKIKYRYLLPVYRLLHLMPRVPKVGDKQNIIRSARMYSDDA